MSAMPEIYRRIRWCGFALTMATLPRDRSARRISSVLGLMRLHTCCFTPKLEVAIRSTREHDVVIL